MRVTSHRAWELLGKAGALLRGHFVGTSRKHMNVYIAKDRGTRLTSVASELCLGIAERFRDIEFDAVVAPAVGGVALSQWTAHHATVMRGDCPEILALYAEHDGDTVAVADEKPLRIEVKIWRGDEEIHDTRTAVLLKGDELIVKHPRFVLKRGFDVDVKGRQILVVEDVLTTGTSALNTARAVLAAHGNVVGVGVLANGGGITAGDLFVRRLESLVVLDRKIYTEEECAAEGLCAKGEPVNLDFGHGRAFIEKKYGGK